MGERAHHRTSCHWHLVYPSLDHVGKARTAPHDPVPFVQRPLCLGSIGYRDVLELCMDLSGRLPLLGFARWVQRKLKVSHSDHFAVQFCFSHYRCTTWTRSVQGPTTETVHHLRHLPIHGGIRSTYPLPWWRFRFVAQRTHWCTSTLGYCRWILPLPSSSEYPGCNQTRARCCDHRYLPRLLQHRLRPRKHCLGCYLDTRYA